MTSLETEIENAEKLHAEIDRILDSLRPRELMDELRHLTENYWTPAPEQREALDR